MENVTLTGEKVYIRPITEADTDNVLKWRNSKAVVENFIIREPVTKEQHMEWLKTKVVTGLVQQFVICRKSNDEGVGSAYYTNVDMKNHSAEAGIFLAEDCIGEGIGVDAFKLLLEFGFDILNLHRVTGRVLSHNAMSRKMNDKTGMQLEARLREEICFDDGYEDLLIYGMLKSEWDAKKQDKQ